LIDGPVGTAELLAEVDVEVDNVVDGLLVEELDVVGATEELFDVLVGTVEVEELVDEVDLTDELAELVDFVVEDEVDWTELDELMLDEVGLTDELVEVDFTEVDEVVLEDEVEELLVVLTDVDELVIV
jgi:hypothetical protein